MKCVPGTEPDDGYSYDEQIRILEASSSDQAYEKACSIGKREEHRYTNLNNEETRWTFEGLYDLEEIGEELSDMLEISSKVFRTKSPDNLVFPKSKLSVFWFDANKDRTAKDILDDN